MRNIEKIIDYFCDIVYTYRNFNCFERRKDMKFRKLFLLVLVSVFAITLTGCTKPHNDKPELVGVYDEMIPKGTNLDLTKRGVTAFDKQDGDLTASVVVTGTVDNTKAGANVVTYSVTDSKGVKVSKSCTITVSNGVYANGTYDYKFGTEAEKATFMRAAEGYLLDNVMGGVPIYNAVGLSLRSDRFVAYSGATKFNNVMGWGNARGDFSQDDTHVTMATGESGVTGGKTLRTWIPGNLTTLNPWVYQSSTESDVLGTVFGSFYAYDYDPADSASFVPVPELAKDMPVAVGGTTNPSGIVISNTWKVPLKENLKWKYHEKTISDIGLANLPETFDADDFVYGYKLAFDNNWRRAFTGGGDFISSGIVGAYDYYSAATKTQALWDEVGLKSVDGGAAVEFEFEDPTSAAYLIYFLNSFVLTAVNQKLVEHYGVGTDGTYGTAPETLAYTGIYALKNVERDVVVTTVKNELFPNATKYNFTGYQFQVIANGTQAFTEFKAGKLDVVAVPAANVPEYLSDPKALKTPAATTWRFVIGGSGNNASLREQTGMDSTFEPEAILQYTEMKQALYFVLNRKGLVDDVLKIGVPQQHYFAEAYTLDPQSGSSWRLLNADNPYNQLSPSTNGYSSAVALEYFKLAVDKAIEDGRYTNNTVIPLEIAVLSTSQSFTDIANYYKGNIENTFKYPEKGITVSVTVTPIEPDPFYDDHALVGAFDIALAGISGGMLDAGSFLDVFSSDNRGGFLLDWGFSTSVPNIEVTYMKNGVEVIEIFSYDALQSLLNRSVEVVNGREK